MARPKPINPPFAWLGRFWVPTALALITLVAAAFRFLHLDTLPPGLDEASARVGLQALQLSWSHWLPAFSASNGYAPLWVWLQAISIGLFGHMALALRIWPALIGVLAVLATWLWLRDWFDRRMAWIGSFAMAVSPWAVTLSRAGVDSALPPLLVPLTLWLGGRAMRQPSPRRYALVGAVLAVDLLSGPLGWLLAAAATVIGLIQLWRRHELRAIVRRYWIGLILLAAGLGLLAYQLGMDLPALRSMPQALGLVTHVSDLVHNLVKVLLMFNVHGDENYRHNLAGEPMLNAFLGLMAVTGLLVSISRAHRLRYRLLLILTGIMLLPPVITTIGVPNSSWAVAALPLVIGLVAVGTSYMLELWYATFPINSAARATGQAAIILLLALTLVQGYTQYFRAWAGSTAVYLAHNEGTVQIAAHMQASKFTGQRIVVVPAEQSPVIDYLLWGRHDYQILQPAGLTSLPLAGTARQFYILAASRDESVKILKAKFPGGVLRPHYSDFNQVEIYYTYESTK